MWFRYTDGPRQASAENRDRKVPAARFFHHHSLPADRFRRSMSPDLSAARNQELDGWRCFAVLGVMWLHWAIPKWRGAIPFEIGLYFFLTLTGFLITRILLRERETGESLKKPWRRDALKRFQFRRALRILIPCYAAMAFGLLVRAPDLVAHPIVYFAHVSNFHLALLPEWPFGTSHYWTLAIQQQFYLVWPLLVFLIPKRALMPVLVGVVALAPISRLAISHVFPQITQPGAISLCALDYLGCGALLGLAMHRGFEAGDRRLRVAAWVCFVIYVVLYAFDMDGRPVPGVRHLQQTFLSVAMTGLIAATLSGLPRGLSYLLTRPWVLHISRISYSLYLLHNLVPLALGFVVPQLWDIGGSVGTGVRLVVFALASWGISWLSWRWIEVPVNRMRSNIPSR